MEIIAFDSHKRYALASMGTPDGQVVREERIKHGRGNIVSFLSKCQGGSAVAVNRERFPLRHVSKLYNRIRGKRGHSKGVGAVGRHLAEATYWMLTRREGYREREIGKVLSTGA